MNVDSQLSSTEVEELKQLLNKLSVAARQPISLNGLFRDWGEFVARVEKGYEDSIYDYTNDLGVRDQLEQVLTQTSPRLLEKLKIKIEPLDRRFFNATYQGERPLLPRGHDDDVGLWWFRIPKILKDELEADLRSEGLLK